MKIAFKHKTKKNKKSALSRILSISAAAAALIGVVLLVNNVYLFLYYVEQYIAQGYTTSVVIKNFLMTDLIPGIAEPLVIYGGIALILFSIRKIYIKIYDDGNQNVKADNEENINIENAETNETEKIVTEENEQ